MILRLISGISGGMFEGGTCREEIPISHKLLLGVWEFWDRAPIAKGLNTPKTLIQAVLRHTLHI